MKSPLGNLFGFRNRNASSVEAGKIRDWLVRKVAVRLHKQQHEVDVNTSLLEYGLDSLHATAISGGLERLLGRRVSPAVVWDYPTIGELAAHLRYSHSRSRRVTARRRR